MRSSIRPFPYWPLLYERNSSFTKSASCPERVRSCDAAEGGPAGAAGRFGANRPPNAPRFADDKEVVPLQAADMLAWLFRRAWNGERSELEWIATELQPAIPMSTHVQILDRPRLENMSKLADEAYKKILAQKNRLP